jgi:PAS domain S-box-containing protein
LLLTEEALELPQASDFLGVLKAQPPWSELPLLVLTSGSESRLARLLDLLAEAARSVTLLERPMGAATLLRSVEVALRSRRRQYEVRALLVERERAAEVKARLAAIVESSDDAIVSKTLDGIIQSWNRGAERLLGYTAAEAVGRSISLIIPPDRMDEERFTLEKLRRGEHIEHFETIRITKDGRTLDVSLSISPLKDSFGKIIGASKVLRDITQRKRVEAALVKAQHELKQHAVNLERIVAERTADLRATNEQLETFVYSIAHDLRAPLRTVTGYSQLLREDYAAGLGETAHQLLSRIQASSEFMDKLMLDLLAYGRTARAQLELGLVQVQNAWESALFQCAAQMEGTHGQVETIQPLPTVVAHESTLGQVLANLLSNALKFTMPGARPRVRFYTEERGDKVRLWVQDGGIGIPKDQHERVFRVFERLNGARYPGTGIGLSIVRKGVERMGGMAGVESNPGNGSQFWIELPTASQNKGQS